MRERIESTSEILIKSFPCLGYLSTETFPFHIFSFLLQPFFLNISFPLLPTVPSHFVEDVKIWFHCYLIPFPFLHPSLIILTAAGTFNWKPFLSPSILSFSKLEKAAKRFPKNTHFLASVIVWKSICHSAGDPHSFSSAFPLGWAQKSFIFQEK